MTVKALIEELKRLGMDVKYRKRVDGGYLIQQINNMTFTGAKGNAYARRVLGVELSQARVEQTAFNVSKYISNQTKQKTLSPEIKKKLKSVQGKWRRKGVRATLTAKKVKQHIKESGEAEAMEYLGKMERYGKGLAYEENVEWLAKYYEDLARGVLTDNSLQDQLYNVAEEIRSKKESFKEEWIGKLYRAGYDILHNIQAGNTAEVWKILVDVLTIIRS